MLFDRKAWRDMAIAPSVVSAVIRMSSVPVDYFECCMKLEINLRDQHFIAVVNVMTFNLFSQSWVSVGSFFELQVIEE